MNATYLGLEIRRIARDPVRLFFTAALPLFFYLVFGAAQDYGSQSAGNGNVAMIIMVSMAAFGAVTASVSIGGMAAVERMQGWGRQLGLTPLPDRGYIAVKVGLALTVTGFPLALVYVAGAFTGARGTPAAWALSALALLIGTTMFALYGLVFALAFRTEGAVSAATGSVVILGFLGNIFFPLSGTMLTIAKFTPLYGLFSLARYPVSGGDMPDGATGELIHEPLWVPLANVGGWLFLLAAVAIFLVRRSRMRQ